MERIDMTVRQIQSTETYLFTTVIAQAIGAVVSVLAVPALIIIGS